MIDQNAERGQDFPDGVLRWRRIFVSAQIDDYPRDVSEKRYGNIWTNETQEGRDDTETDDVVSQHGAVSDDVAECPHGLLTHVLMR